MSHVNRETVVPGDIVFAPPHGTFIGCLKLLYAVRRGKTEAINLWLRLAEGGAPDTEVRFCCYDTLQTDVLCSALSELLVRNR